MFRRETTPKLPCDEESLEVRLGALGRFLDARGYAADGLCVLGVDGGFVVDGVARPGRGAAARPAQQGDEVTAAELAAVLAQRRGAA